KKGRPPARDGPTMANVCKRVHYSGRVQGVGFRYTAQALAAGYPVAGYVRNLRDGRVELVAQGEPGQVDAFLGAVERNMAGYIAAAAANEAPRGPYRGFGIRR